jgi:hypothetical protein
MFIYNRLTLKIHRRTQTRTHTWLNSPHALRKYRMEKELILLINCRLILLWRDDELVDGVVSLAHDRKRERGHLVCIALQITIANEIFDSAWVFELRHFLHFC